MLYAALARAPLSLIDVENSASSKIDKRQHGQENKRNFPAGTKSESYSSDKGRYKLDAFSELSTRPRFELVCVGLDACGHLGDVINVEECSILTEECTVLEYTVFRYMATCTQYPSRLTVLVLLSSMIGVDPIRTPSIIFDVIVQYSSTCLHAVHEPNFVQCFSKTVTYKEPSDWFSVTSFLCFLTGSLPYGS